MAIRSRRAMARQDAIDRHAHVGEPHRIVQMIERRVQKAARQLRIAEPALTQQPRDDRRDAERRRQPLGGRVVARRSVPVGAIAGIRSVSFACRRQFTTEDTKDTEDQDRHASRTTSADAVIEARNEGSYRARRRAARKHVQRLSVLRIQRRRSAFRAPSPTCRSSIKASSSDAGYRIDFHRRKLRHRRTQMQSKNCCRFTSRKCCRI